MGACVHEPAKYVNKLREGLVKVINRTKHTGTDYRERESERERKKVKRLTIGCLENEGWRRG